MYVCYNESCVELFFKIKKNMKRCKLCYKDVKTSGTTNLFTHLKTKHLFTFNELMKKKSKVSINFQN